MRGGCALESLSCQYSVLGALLRPTVEKYRMLTTLKEIRLSTSENWWCWLCLCRVALLVLPMHKCKTKPILLSTVGFVMIHHRHTAVRREFKILLQFSHMLHTNVPTRCGGGSGERGPAGCDVRSVFCHYKLSQVLRLGKSSLFKTVAWKGASYSLPVVLWTP